MDLSNPANLLLASIYYLIVGVLVFFSIFAVYILNHHGESKLTALVISLLYCIFFLTILSQSFGTFQSIK